MDSESDGELVNSDQEEILCSIFAELESCCTMDPRACTHTHICNPPGPDNSHTHTCVHTHTEILPSTSEDQVATDNTAKPVDKTPKKCPRGNCLAVRKYREKKKAEAASLVAKVARLTAENRQLMLKLQGLPALEAENARLKYLLVDIRGRIEGETGPFPYQNQANGGDVYQNLANSNFPAVINPCSMQCNNPWEEGKNGEGVALDGLDFVGCEFKNMQCFGNMSSSSGSKELPGCGIGNTASTVDSSGRNKKRSGGARAAMAS